jgi:inward rectifier potassium channel
LSAETAETLRDSKATFVLSLSGTDENTGQVLMARAEYSDEDIRWNATFHDFLEEGPDGKLHIDFSKFHDVEPLADTDPPQH